MEQLLEGRVALVTGGGRGIGKAIAARLAEAGASVVIASRKAEILEAAAAELPGKVVAIPCHIGRKEQVEALVARIEADLGSVDILVNNGATALGQGPALEVTEEALLKTFEINVVAAHRLIRLIAPGMQQKGRGVVINVASIAGIRPQEQGLAYSASKAALIMVTRSWAVELGRWGVRVNAIAPGLIKTDFSAYFWESEEHMRRLEATQPLPRIGLPEEVAGMALYLASDQASFVTGQTFVVDGGATCA